MEEQSITIVEAQEPVNNDLKGHLQEIAKYPKLTLKNKRFCELFNDFTNFDTFGKGKESALKAGYSEINAANIAYELLQKPQIKAYLTLLDDEIKAQVNISKDAFMRILVIKANTCKAESVQARYWEMIGRSKGYIEGDDKATTNVSLFQSLDGKIGQRLQVIETNTVKESKSEAVNPQTLHNEATNIPLVADNLT